MRMDQLIIIEPVIIFDINNGDIINIVIKFKK